MEYKIVNEHGFQSLEENVNKLIKEGWRVSGGVSIFSYEDTDFSGIRKIWTIGYAQAMVRD